MKKIFLMSAAAAAMIFASCSKEKGGEGPNTNTNMNVAYLAIDVDLQPNTRGSSEENDAPEESALKSLYLVTFNETGSIVGIPGGSAYYIAVTSGTLDNPEAVKVSAAAKNLVVIANPGTKLLTALNTLNSTSTFATFNTAIEGVNINEIVDDVNRGFAMITSGTEPETITSTTNKIINPYVDIDGKIVAITSTEAEAKAAAEAARVPVKLERLSSKLTVNVAGTGSRSVHPAGATFDFENMKWTVDAVNGMYFPFAEKNLRGNHTAGNYKFNFYTEDPNFDDVNPATHSGIVFGTVAPVLPAWSFEPILPWNGYYGWKINGNNAYVIENTMAADAQRYGNATRLVIKSTYTPAGFTAGEDWFQWAGVNYTFTNLQAKYNLDDDVALVSACDHFFGEIKDYYTHSGQIASLTASDFASLTQAELDGVDNGGEVVKDGANAVIRWYQKGLNYYFYEIRHDNEADGTMAFAKYGVVRNNSYKLTLNSVSGAGTPWYPDITNPGQDDPKKEDPIDEEAGYLGITVSVGEWILWDTLFGI